MRETYSCMRCRIKKNMGISPKLFLYKRGEIFVNIQTRVGECEECAIARYKRVFEKIDEAVSLGILGARGEKWLIDWYLFIDTRINPGEYETGFYYRLIDILVELRIFTIDFITGSHIIVCDRGGPIINPYDKNNISVFFIREEDAKEYARKCLKDTQYEWNVVQIGAVFKKKDVVR